MRKKVTQIILTLLLMGTIIQTTALTLPPEIKQVSADTYPNYIIILPNGTVVGQPSGNPIQQNADNYTYLQTSDISGYGIMIERNNMTLNGNSHTITGTQYYTGIGINVTGQSQVLLNDLQVYEFQEGVEFAGSTYCQLYGSNVSGGNPVDSSSIGIFVKNSTNITVFHDQENRMNGYQSYHRGIELNGSSFCLVFNSTAWYSGIKTDGSGTDGFGIYLEGSGSYNDVFDNDVENNHDGIGVYYGSNYNSVTNNIVQGNNRGTLPTGYNIETGNTTYDAIYKNVVNCGPGGNEVEANAGSTNISWDGGQPSYTNGGNQWSNYNGTYNESTHIGEANYTIDSNDIDYYPLELYNYTYVHLTVQSAGNGTTDPPPDTYPVPYPGMNMTITPIAAPGYVFSYWLEDGSEKGDDPITIPMDSNHTLEAYFSVKKGGGCPYVSDWNGSGYVLDNNILPASENGNGTDAKDYYLLQQPLVQGFSTKQKSVYSLQISEFENNVDYIDQVQLEAVDHSEDTGIAVTQQGEIISYKNLASPISCVDNFGNNVMTQIYSMNGNVSDPSTYYQGNKGDWLLLDFGRVTGPTANFVLRDDEKCAECIDVQVPNSTGGWQTMDVLNPRDFWSIEDVNMTAYLPKTGDFIVRLLWTQSHRLDYVGLDTSAQAPVQVSSVPPTLAIHSTMGDVTQKLLYADKQYVELVNGQQITLWFTLPNQAQGTTRSFILYTDGYYYTITS